MEQNPYQSPESPGFVRLRDRWRVRWPVSRFELAVHCGLVVFLVAAIAHRCQLPFLDDHATEASIKAYTGSPLIALEVVGVLGALASIPVLIVRSIYLFWQKRFFAAVTALVL